MPYPCWPAPVCCPHRQRRGTERSFSQRAWYLRNSSVYYWFNSISWFNKKLLDLAMCYFLNHKHTMFIITFSPFISSRISLLHILQYFHHSVYASTWSHFFSFFFCSSTVHPSDIGLLWGPSLIISNTSFVKSSSGSSNFGTFPFISS